VATVKRYLRNTQANGGTGGAVYDLSTTQGSPASLVSASISATGFTEVFRWQVDLGSAVPGSTIDTSIVISAVSSAQLLYRWAI
jgi:hypothetical protein